MRAESSALLAAAAAQVEPQPPALTQARPEPLLCSPRHCPYSTLAPKPRPEPRPRADRRRLRTHALRAAAPHEVMHSQVEAQQGGMAEQRDRLHALLASQAAEKEALESEALASAAERAGLASQLLELQVGCSPVV